MRFEDVFSFENLLKCGRACCKGVRWKTSTKNFETKLLTTIHDLKRQLDNGSFKTKGFASFTLRERGKIRQIKAVHITERAVQKCLCDYYLLPLFTPTFIYDNGACLKGKGVSFAVSRVKTHIHRYWLKNKTNTGYVLQFDIKSFFDSIDHKILLDVVESKITDRRVFDLYKHFILAFGGGKGLGLGSQISQVSASIYLNGLDHFIKERLRCKHYVRYMDDAIIISNDKEKLEMVLEHIVKICSDLNISLNIKKTHITKLENGFTFLKRRFILFKNGKIVLKPFKKNIRRYCKKILKLKKKNIDIKAVQISFVGYLKQFNYFDKYTRRVYEKFKTVCQ